jgi:LPXTG-motif cell wall-anchored protein
VPLTLAGTQFSGELPETFPLAAGQSRTVQLRLGLPMGTPHNGDSNGGTDHLKLTTLVSYGASGAANATDEETVKVDGLATALSGVPATATAGGPPVAFRATVSNPTASAYENVTDVLFTSRYTTVQVQHSGTWTTLQPRTDSTEPGIYGFDIIGKDTSLTAHSTTTVKVRVTYNQGAPAGPTVKAGGSASPTPTASATPTTPTATTAPATTPTQAPAQLAKTGTGGASTAAVAGATLVAAGAGALGFAARRRRNRA